MKMTVEQAMQDLKFSSISSVAVVLFEKFPRRRQKPIKRTTKLTTQELNALKFHRYRKVTVTGGKR
ncbi:MAG: hypothetical protein KME46_29815 [Brasilonema angustatum HA4187-MV1]|jgi:hypothetical protein|nr:hypothetical protein [Brasilonema sp. CT11]MBW4596980.1 hypothetical protein [Brasilonema angustatum HA4187-MV1]